MAQWSERDMAAVLAAAVEQLTVVKNTHFMGQVGNVFQFEVKLRNAQTFIVNVAEK
jgi:hypothetical protein